jgi:hypothetical protein
VLSLSLGFGHDAAAPAPAVSWMIGPASTPRQSWRVPQAVIGVMPSARNGAPHRVGEPGSHLGAPGRRGVPRCGTIAAGHGKVAREPRVVTSDQLAAFTAEQLQQLKRELGLAPPPPDARTTWPS